MARRAAIRHLAAPQFQFRQLTVAVLARAAGHRVLPAAAAAAWVARVVMVPEFQQELLGLTVVLRVAAGVLVLSTPRVSAAAAALVACLLVLRERLVAREA